MAKELQITSSKIEVSSNSLTGSYFVFHKVKGILPGCRKVSDLTFSPMSGYIWVKNLWSHNGSANIKPEDWAELVKASPVVEERLRPYPLTPEVIADAYEHALRITNCPAVSDTGKYQPKFDTMVVVNSKTATSGK